MQPRKPRAELWTLSLVLDQLRGAEGFPPPPHSLTPRSAQGRQQIFPLHPPRISRLPLGCSQLGGRWGTRGRVESAPEIKRPNKKLIV